MSNGRRMVVLLALLTAVLGGCARTGYYLQSVRGQLELLSKREPIEELIADPATPPELAGRLGLVLGMREFAIRELGLPDNRSYRSYADIGRAYVVWNVFAAPPLDVEPRTWCFPFVGCLAYRGYFDAGRARDYAGRLAARGDDVYVAGVTAYSTLGHFADPVLSTMLRGDDVSLAGVLFHELAHQQLYIRGDTEFNEAFASLIEEEGVRRWLATRDDTSGWETWRERQRRRSEFSELVNGTRERLRTVYASAGSDAEKLAQKQEILDELRGAHARMRADAGGDSGYERWFAGALNNAQLASVATYRRFVPAFRDLLARENGDLRAFYARAARIGAMPDAQRQQLMEGLLAQAGSDSGARAAAELVEPPATGLVAQ